eukprot:TRINITY_DN23884_c0_g1_i2.p1 TRINITY_DN23884_c0_g1~~TRINITY_DN23884_c0_g1_i2.p1  ORF type:complete len:304 (+),score=40.73 TRINITY_DN23884_c0_g1_i2:63-974(+)
MSPSSAQEQLEGTCLVVGAACVFALVALVVKKDPLPLVIATECRFLVSWIVAIVFMLLYRRSRNLHWFGPPELRMWLLLKCAGSFAFITTWWSAIRQAPVGNCIAIIYCSPILTSLLSRVLLKEMLPRQFPLQVLLVSAGCLLVLNPPFLHSSGGGDGTASRGDYRLVFLALCLASLVPIITRKAKDCSWIEVEHVSACLASTLLDPSLVLVQYLFCGQLPPVPPAAPKEAFLIIIAAMGAFVGIAMETKGYQLAEPGKATMCRYVEVPFAYVLQKFFTSDKRVRPCPAQDGREASLVPLYFF